MLRKALGVLLIVIGFIALLTPLTPGSWLIFIGAEILGIEFLSRERVMLYVTRIKQWFKDRTRAK